MYVDSEDGRCLSEGGWQGQYRAVGTVRNILGYLNSEAIDFAIMRCLTYNSTPKYTHIYPGELKMYLHTFFYMNVHSRIIQNGNKPRCPSIDE